MQPFVFLLVILFVSFFTFVFPKNVDSNSIVNERIDRKINLSKHIVHVKTDIRYQSTIGSEKEYYLLISKTLVDNHLSKLTATCNGKSCDLTKMDTSAGFVSYKAHNMENPDGNKIVTNMYLTHALQPYPEEITQYEDQFVKFEALSHLVASPYKTLSQTTKVVLPSKPKVEFYSKQSPVNLKGTKIEYGPYVDVEPFMAPEKPLSVHFRQHAKFITLTNVVKEIEVSMWGQVSVEEVYDLMHTGAKLKGGFSRLDYSHFNKKSASYESLTGTLPKDAQNHYYRDIIGNVTTSRLRVAKTHQKLVITPRFPIFGGWKTQWYWGYTLPTESCLTRNGKTFQLSVDFSTPVEDATVDQLLVKVILPEGASNPMVSIPFDIDSKSTTKRMTFLDSSLFGRPVLIFSKSNLIPQHNVPFLVTFDFEEKYMLHELGLLVAAYMTFFLLCMAILRLDINLPSKSKTQ